MASPRALGADLLGGAGQIHVNIIFLQLQLYGGSYDPDPDALGL